jgi:hypothetical protein
MTGEPGDKLSFIPGLAHSPAALSLSGQTHRHGFDRGIEPMTMISVHLKRDVADEGVR